MRLVQLLNVTSWQGHPTEGRGRGGWIGAIRSTDWIWQKVQAGGGGVLGGGESQQGHVWINAKINRQMQEKQTGERGK